MRFAGLTSGSDGGIDDSSFREARAQFEKEYLVIKVNQFTDSPIICRKDGVDTNAGAIYYRNKNRRIESARISNSYDMRDLILLATSGMMSKISGIGFYVEQIDKKKFKEELGDL